MKIKYQFVLAVAFSLLAAIAKAGGDAEQDPAEVLIGERLFLETRFAQAEYANPGKADPVLAKTITTNEPLPGPFAGQTINCRACHMVDEHAEHASAGMRTYADFAHRSPVPNRDDGQQVSPRNSMSLVNISLPREHGSVFHFDGEFNSMEDLVQGTLTDRNYGWLASEKSTAIKHIARVIREDDGKDALAQEFGGSYRKILTGTAADIQTAFRLPAEYRVNVATASDKDLVMAVAKLITAYVTDLTFSQDDDGQYNGSPYDRFLQKNRLPRKPDKGESTAAYSQRLTKAINTLQSPSFVGSNEDKFASHQQTFAFGEKEFAGLKLFLNKGSTSSRGGNCIACHSAPHFSDFGFHNTGVTQVNYDIAHGQGEFQKLDIPDLGMRNKQYQRYLPATDHHPDASGRFRDISNKHKPGHTDLGLWNVFANPDIPAPQSKLKEIVCAQLKPRSVTGCDTSTLLSFTIAAFKTPGLRDLGHSAPYMHNGEFIDLEAVLGLYITSSVLAKNGQLRNADAALQHIHLSGEDIDPLVAFLKSLNEDYD